MITCPNCGDDMQQWQADIYECEGCGNMFDIEALEGEE